MTFRCHTYDYYPGLMFQFTYGTDEEDNYAFFAMKSYIEDALGTVTDVVSYEPKGKPDYFDDGTFRMVGVGNGYELSTRVGRFYPPGAHWPLMRGNLDWSTPDGFQVTAAVECAYTGVNPEN